MAREHDLGGYTIATVTAARDIGWRHDGDEVPAERPAAARGDEMSDDEEILVDGSRFRVARVRLPRRDGGVSTREIVRHPGSVVVLPLLDDDRVVLIRNRRHALGATLWELCAGTLEVGEEPLGCAHRELAEETGYRADTMEPLFSFFPAPGISDERMFAFVARGLQLGAPRLDPTEVIETHVRGREACAAMLADGTFMDGKTMLLLHWWLRGA